MRHKYAFVATSPAAVNLNSYHFVACFSWEFSIQDRTRTEPVSIVRDHALDRCP